MWLFTPFGFFSIVADTDNPENLVVRGRERRDIERFRAAAALPNTPIVALPMRDYAFRIILPRDAVARVLVRFVGQKLTYTNFKDEVHRVQGAERAHLYHGVWSIMLGLQKKLARAVG